MPIPSPFKPAPRKQSPDECLHILWRRCDRPQKLRMLAVMERLVAAQNRAAVHTK
ncbi:hypothetical protein [Azospirillum palustre]